MNYEEFLDYIRDNLAESYKEIMFSNQDEDDEEIERTYDNCKVFVQRVLKNNGIELDAVSIYVEGKHLSPNIYLKPFYDSYRMGKPLNIILTEIVYQYKKYSENVDIEIANPYDFDNVRSNIVFRLVNYDKNRDLLKNCPHKRFLDLAVTFRCIINEDEIGLASIMVTNKEFEKWEVDLEDLYQLAIFNTTQHYPWQMIPISKVVLDCFEDRIDELPKDVSEELNNLKLEETGVNMFVLTNQNKTFGAGCVLYDNVVRNFSKVQDANIFIMPSSVHEVMLIPEDDMTSAAFLYDLLCEANKSSVGLIDLLSDNIYYYDRDLDKINICCP